MSIYADVYIIDLESGKAKLVKHLNKTKIDRGGHNVAPGGWNKTGKKAQLKKFKGYYLSRSRRKKFIILEIC